MNFFAEFRGKTNPRNSVEKLIRGLQMPLILSISKPSISQRPQIKEDTAEPSAPAREFNLKAYAAIT